MLVKIIDNTCESKNKIGDIGILVGDQVFVDGRDPHSNWMVEEDYVEITHIDGKKVLEVVMTPGGNTVVVTESWYNTKHYAYTTSELEGYELTLKKEEKPVEITMEEIANKFNVSIDKLRIKE